MTDFQPLFCPQCELPEHACLCIFVPKILSNATFWLLTHDSEHDKATNTGKLIQMIWPQSRLVHWSRTQPDKALLQQLADHPGDFVLVFPEQYAIPEQQSKVLPEHEICLTNQPTSFIIIDATWQQARKIYRKSDYLHSLPLISLLPKVASVYSLRRNQNERYLCTAEVAAQVLRQSGESLQGDLLDALLQHFCHQFEWSRKSQKQVLNSPAMEFLKKYSKS